nr:hypothetical protein [Tanacetum cinerariifolium]GEZ18277.1 hypothetical protein [Tanacetum cinerariifolium]
TLNPTAASQIALDNALVPPEERLKIGECNRRIEFSKPQREATYQITLDALKLSPFYPAFLITANVQEIYMHQLWNTFNKVQGSSSYRFKLDNKMFRVDVEVFRDILQICPKLLDQPFDIPSSTDEEIVSFIYELGYTRNIKTLPELVVDHIHQPLRTFAAVINRCISGKTTGLDKLRLSRAQILNKINLHTARDDSLLGTLKYVSKTEERQVYRALIPKEMINEDILNSTTYHTYFAYANGVKEPIKARKFKKPASPKLKTIPVSPKEPTKKPAKKQEPAKKDVPAMKSFRKSQAVKKDFHISHASGLGDGTDIESGAPDEQHRKIFGTDEETGTKPGVLDVPKYDSESEKESWGNSGEEDDDDEDDSKDESDDDMDNDDDNDDDGDNDDGDNNNNDDNDETDSDRTDLNQSSIKDDDEEEKIDEEEDDDVTEELYEDVNVNLGNRDTDMTDAEQGEQINTMFLIKEALAEKKEYIDLIDTSVRTIIKEEVKTQLPQILPKAVSDFATPVIEQNVTESLEDVVLAKSSSQPKSTYELYDALVKSYNTDKDLFDTYGEVFTLKRGRDDKDRDQDPSVGSDRRTKRRKSSKEAESSKDPRLKETTTERLDYHNPEGKPYSFDLHKPLLLIPDHRGRQVIPQDYFINNDLEYLKGGSLSRQYSTFVTKTKAATYEIKWIEDMVPNLWSPVKVVYDKHAYWGTSHWVTRLTIMKWYDYGYLDEIEVRREDQQLYTFKEGDFPRLRLQDIEDMLLLLVQQKLINLTIEERYDLNVELRMFTNRVIIQRRVEDLHLGVESYQKKLNLTKPNTFRLDLKKRTAFTSYSGPQGVIYVD